MPARLRSRKFWIAVVGALLVIANQGLGLDLPSDTVLAFAAIIIGYLFAEGAADAIRAANGAP